MSVVRCVVLFIRALISDKTELAVVSNYSIEAKKVDSEPIERMFRRARS